MRDEEKSKVPKEEKKEITNILFLISYKICYHSSNLSSRDFQIKTKIQISKIIL